MVGLYSEEGKQGGVISVGVGEGLWRICGQSSKQENLWLVIVYLGC